MCSPLCKIPVTAAEHRSTVHSHQSQQRRTGVGQRRMAVLNKVSQWNQSLVDSVRRSWRPFAKKTKPRPQSPGTVSTGLGPAGWSGTGRIRSMYPKPRSQLSSHLSSPPTQVDATVPASVNVETPLSPFLRSLTTWDSSETLNDNLSRSRSSRSTGSAVSAIMPSKG